MAANLDKHVTVMAQQLGLEWQRDPIGSIVAYCIKKISDWTDGGSAVRTIPEVEALACEKLQLVFEEVWSDQDLDEIIRKYVEKGELVFASLKTTFDLHTYAALFERRKATKSAKDRHVAVIDCRGNKASRRFFTRWHEIAHMLTLYEQLEFPFHRSTRGGQNPRERLMDKIAGEVAFYGPIFTPGLKDELAKVGYLTFQIVDNVRNNLCPDASFQASLIACAKRADIPVVYVEGRMALKKAERSDIESGQQHLFEDTIPQEKFRAAVAIQNASAQATEFDIHQNMTIPKESVLHKIYHQPDPLNKSQMYGEENLNIWVHSDGRAIGSRNIRVEGKVFDDKVIAIIQPM